jgi:hypothetical protein
MTAMAVTASRRRLLPGQYTARYARARGGREQGAMEGAGSNGGWHGTRVPIELHVVYFITTHTAHCFSRAGLPDIQIICFS